MQKGLGTKVESLQVGLGTKVDNLQEGLCTKVEILQEGLGTKVDNLQEGLGTKVETLHEGLGTKMDNIQVGLDSLQATQQSVKKMLSGLKSKSFGKCKHEKLFKQKPNIKQVLTVMIRKVNQSACSCTYCLYPRAGKCLREIYTVSTPGNC